MSIRRLHLLFFVSTITLYTMQGMIHNPPNHVQAKETRYNHNSIKIEELINTVDFTVLIPERLPHKYSLEIKTYPKRIRLHYMNKDDTALLIGIDQRKASNTHTEPTFQDVETVMINGNKGFFKTFSNAPGGILSWRQDGTSLVMDSNTATKKEMIDIACSMKVAK
ncbi:DUF4367 domain-containing protein [Rossellomorea sp. NS-SX7]|uniref:DUF4367 domain-containing protein n=1 Tax=Rossellomorea sp. NS-SX7 TaxID=3463856 RepID=UPI0040595858